jgi:hypothetical protein
MFQSLESFNEISKVVVCHSVQTYIESGMRAEFSSTGSNKIMPILDMHLNVGLSDLIFRHNIETPGVGMATVWFWRTSRAG